MKSLSYSAVLFFTLFLISKGEDFAAHIIKLSNSEVSVRNKAQEQVIEKLKFEKNTNILKNALNIFFTNYVTSNSPETKTRLISIMEQVAPIYRDSLGTPFVGVELEDRLERINGVHTQSLLVGKVMKDSPANKAGIKRRDRITSIDGIHFEHSPFAEFGKIREKYAPGEQVILTIYRGEKTLQIPLTFGKIPSQSARKLLDRGLSYTEDLDQFKPAVIKTDLPITQRHVEQLELQIISAEFLQENSFFSRWFKEMANSIIL